MRWPLRIAALLLCACLLAASALAQDTGPGAQDRQDDQARDPAATFKVDVKLVNVFATVVDENGRPVADLGKNDFRIFEDGNPEKIAVFDQESELPLSIVLALDASLSTRRQLKEELEYARTFVHSILRPVDRVALYQFNEWVDEVVPFTNDRRRIDRGIKRVRIGAATALYDAIYLGSRTLLDRDGRKVMVLISDGGDTLSTTPYRDALRAAQEAEAIVYSIIIVPIHAQAGRNTAGEHALIQLSQDTGGKHYYAGSAEQLQEAFQQISRELRNQYLLAYYPARRLSSSEFRRIQVRVDREDLSVRHRTGYYTSKPR